MSRKYDVGSSVAFCTPGAWFVSFVDGVHGRHCHFIDIRSIMIWLSVVIEIGSFIGFGLQTAEVERVTVRIIFAPGFLQPHCS